MSSPWPRSSTESWFRIGRLEVTTVVFVILTALASMVAWVVFPPITGALAMAPSPVFSGQVWRLVTWPLADGLSLWSVINLVMLWYFGSDLEGQLGRVRMAGFLVGLWAALTTATLLVGLASPTSIGLAGLGMIEFCVLGVWIADNPRRPFFFGIPAWVVGLVLLGIQVLGLVAARGWSSLLALLLGLLLAAIVARRSGLLRGYAMIPGSAPRTRAARPSAADRASARQATRRASDRERLDALLDKINETGIGSLTAAERKELHDLRDRLRSDR